MYAFIGIWNGFCSWVGISTTDLYGEGDRETKKCRVEGGGVSTYIVKETTRPRDVLLVVVGD